MAGAFIVFEGPEGSGKSTQANWLAERLRREGHTVVLTREPGGTALGERVRALLLTQDDDGMLPETEALLYAAARAQHVGETVRPALDRGEIVVCDRFVDSSIAYQAGGRGLPIEEVRAIQRLATGGLVPDLRILLDLPVEVGLGRRFASSDQVNRLDRADVAFHNRVRSLYLHLAADDPGGWVVIDATRAPEVVRREVDQAVDSVLSGRGAKGAGRAAPLSSGGVE